jgi:serine/threonine protein kinase/WD40 repeat protein
MITSADKIDQIFWNALQFASEEERGAYLDRVCEADPDLRRLIEKLLRAQPKAAAFLEQPLAESPATVDQPIRECPGTVVGPYKLLEQIGEGGFGVVFQAEQTEPVRRKVALKVLKPGMETRQVVARFEAERQALALMDHPNIARVLDGGQTASGRPYFVMELVKGVPITQFCDQNHWSVRERLKLFVSVCRAVQHAHQKGIIHRDIKPSNVLAALHDGTPVPKVIDFGIAKATAQPLTDKTLFTGFAQMIGTPLYMSPEQAAGGPDIDTRTDIYSLGVLLYELLTGTPPFDKERFKEVSYDEIRRIIREEEPPKPSTRISTLGQAANTAAANRQTEPRRLSQLFRGELDWVVMKALEKDRNRRYETANAFAADVQRHLNDEPVQACPPSAAYRLGKFARRHRQALLTAVLLAVVLVGSLAALALRESFAAARLRLALGLVQTESELKDQANEKLEKEKEALRRKERQAKIDLSTAFLDKGLALCEEGQVGLGLLWLARSLEVAPDDAAGLQRAVRGNLGAWSHQVSHLRGIMPERYSGVAVEFSRDGKTLLTSGESARAWDTATGQPLGPPFARGWGPVVLGPDSKFALILNQNGLWRFDLVTGRALGPPLQFEGGQSPGHQFNGFSPDRKLVLTRSKDDKAVRLWDVATGKPVGRPLPHPEGFEEWGAVFSPDSKKVVTVVKRVARLWDVATGQPLGQAVARLKGVGGVFFSPDGKTLALSLGDKLQLCNAATGKLEGPPQPWSGNWWSARVGPFLRKPRLDVTLGRRGLRAVVKNGVEPGEPQLVALNPAGAFILTHYEDGSSQLWDGLTGRPVGALLPSIHCLEGRRATFSDHDLDLLERVRAVSPDARLYTTYGQRTCRLYEVGTGKPHGEILVPGPSRHTLFSTDGRFMLCSSATRGGKGRFHLARTTGEVIARAKGDQPTWEIQAGAFSPDGTTILTVQDALGVSLWVAEQGKLSLRWWTRPWFFELQPGMRYPTLWNDGRTVVAFSPDGKTILAGGGVGTKGAADEDGQGVAQLLDLGRKPLGPLLPHPAPVQALAFSPDGKKFLTGCGQSLRTAGGEARLWDATSGRLIGGPFRHLGAVTAVAFSPDGKTILTGSADGTARLWDVATGRTFCPPLAHAATVRAVRPHGSPGPDRERGRHGPAVGRGNGQAPGPRLAP